MIKVHLLALVRWCGLKAIIFGSGLMLPACLAYILAA
jgi:hypothetical protein